ncbi:MAG: hypothetical protein HZB13_09930 [Acidobacteria bacterium]|nr:hypothetical protein [Acidobacteriota bacterium]
MKHPARHEPHIPKELWRAWAQAAKRRDQALARKRLTITGIAFAVLAFVEMAQTGDVQTAISRLNRATLNGRAMNVNPAHPKA